MLNFAWDQKCALEVRAAEAVAAKALRWWFDEIVF